MSETLPQKQMSHQPDRQVKVPFILSSKVSRTVLFLDKLVGPTMTKIILPALFQAGPGGD